jgi:hypothetical protein
MRHLHSVSEKKIGNMIVDEGGHLREEMNIIWFHVVVYRALQMQSRHV